MCFAAKPAPKPKPKPKLGSIGTSQLPGSWCDFGKEYTLGRANAMNLTVKSAEYTIGRVTVGDRIFYPEMGKKLLVVRFSMHNPLAKDQNVSYATYDWTAVDAKDQNVTQEYESAGIEGSGVKLDQAMKPAQKIDMYIVFRVAADGEVPKLMVANHSDSTAPIARYDLRGKVKPLPAPFADPSDKTGATVAKPIPCVMGACYSTGKYDMTVEKVDFATAKLRNESYDATTDYVLVTLAIKFLAGGSGALDANNLILKDTDGVSYQPMYSYTMPLSSYVRLEQTLYKGDSIKYRQAYTVPKGTKLQSLILKEADGYPYAVDISAYSAP